MNVEQLIEYVTAEVLKRINKATKKKALIIGQEGEIILQCQKAIASDYEVETSCHYDMDGDYDYIVLASVDTDFLANAAIGLLKEKYPVIHKALMEGTPIDIIEEGMAHRNYASTCSANFYALVLGYEEKVQSFGMTIKPMTKLSKVKQPKLVIESVVTEDQPVTKDQAVTISRKLITEQLLKNELAQGTTRIQVGQSALVTPLASDYAREHHMTIIKM